VEGSTIRLEAPAPIIIRPHRKVLVLVLRQPIEGRRDYPARVVGIEGRPGSGAGGEGGVVGLVRRLAVEGEVECGGGRLGGDRGAEGVTRVVRRVGGLVEKRIQRKRALAGAAAGMVHGLGAEIGAEGRSVGQRQHLRDEPFAGQAASSA